MKVLFSTLILLLFQANVIACSCFFRPMSVRHVIETNLVFKGEVIHKETVDKVGGEQVVNQNSNFGLNYFKYTFRIEELIKGESSLSTVDVYSHTQGASCGVNYDLGSRLIIYSHLNAGHFFTGSCSQNTGLQNVNKRYGKMLKRFKRSRRNKRWKNIEGDKIAKGKIVKQKAEGNWMFYHEDNSIESMGTFLNGLPDGVWKYYRNEAESKERFENLTKEDQAKESEGQQFMFRVVKYENGKILEEDYFS